MDIETRLRMPESRYRAALSVTAAANAHYLALAGAPSATPNALERAKWAGQKLDARKRAIAARMGEIEELAQDAIV
jgi:hypothetical protein